MKTGNPSLESLRQVSFDWVTRLDDIWMPSQDTAPPIQERAWEELQREVRSLLADSTHRHSRLGRVMTGSGGTGKTHLLGRLRREFMRYGGFFILVDCTDLKDFWPSLLLNLVNSLHRPLDEHWSQWGALRYHLTVPHFASHEECIQQIELSDPDLICQSVQFLIDETPALKQAQSKGITNIASILRAVFFMTSPDADLREIGTMWLQGIDPDEADARRLRLRGGGEDKDKVKAISYVTQLVAPTLFAFDQLDSLIATHHLRSGREEADPTSEQRRAQAIIEGLGGGLMGLYDHSFWSMTLLSCLTSSWEVIEKQLIVGSAKERFSPEIIRLGALGQLEAASTLIRSRLEPVYQQVGFTPPYPTYPFPSSFLKEGAQLTPRQLLQHCDQHVRACVERGEVVEPGGDSGQRPVTPEDSFEVLDNEWQKALSRARPHMQGLMGEIAEDTLGRLFHQALSLLRFELTLSDNVDFAMDSDFLGTRNYPSLHTRIRLIFRDENEREEHIGLRILEKTHHSSFRARLGAAMVESGIDRDLPFRRLILFRNAHLNIGGNQTEEVMEKFRQAGGKFLPYNREDVTKLRALLDLNSQRLNGWERWMKERQWISQSTSFAPLVTLLKSAIEGRSESLAPEISEQPGGSSSSIVQEKPLVTYAKDAALFLGNRLTAGKPGDPVTLPLQALSKHIVIRAGSGGGKTVLLKRIMEEAALSGVSSIVLDPGNDLAQMVRDWPQPPETWTGHDRARAAQFRREVDTVIYTPGLKSGRPVNLPVLPDFSIIDDEDDRNFAVGMALDSLRPFLINGRGAKANRQLGLLAATLRHFAKQKMQGIENFIQLLRDLPQEAEGDIRRAGDLAAELADNFRAALQVHPDLISEENLLDFSTLFGIADHRPRISIINFSGLPSLEAQQQFINRMSVALFTWMKKNPSSGPTGMSGLFVIDEAKDFLPATRGAACKTNLMRLCSQARKYGLGLMFATQNPKDLDYNAVSQFSTQFFGRANSPQVIEFISRLLEEKGGTGRELARLNKGEFYVSSSEGIAPPLRLKVPLCLTAHPDGQPLTSDEIAAHARDSFS